MSVVFIFGLLCGSEIGCLENKLRYCTRGVLRCYWNMNLGCVEGMDLCLCVG